MVTPIERDVATPERPSPVRAYLFVVAAGVLGGGSLILFTVFLYAGSLHLVDLALGDGAALALDALLSVLFFLQHSLMTRAGFRRRLSRLVREEFQAAVFAAASGLVLLAVVVLWQETAQALLAAQGGLRWTLRGLFVLALVGSAWGERALRPLDTLGLRSIRRSLAGKPPRETPLAVRGPYRWVRHPLYFLSLVLIWTCPDLTLDRLLFNVLWTVWILVGTLLEERDLVRTFGDPYREYQRRVPMLVPYRLPRSCP